MIKLLLVGAGGFVGSVLRFGVYGLAHRYAPGWTLPLGTLAVNVIGCFVIGLLAAVVEARDVATAQTRWFVIVGMLGGFTTFSAFGFETFALIREGAAVKAAGNVLANVILGTAAVWVGYMIARA